MYYVQIDARSGEASCSTDNFEFIVRPAVFICKQNTNLNNL